jgi:hypothetical protein
MIDKLLKSYINSPDASADGQRTNWVEQQKVADLKVKKKKWVLK